MKNKYFLLIFLIVLLLVAATSFLFILKNRMSERASSQVKTFVEGRHNPVVIPREFSNNINNKYLTFTPGDKYVYYAIVEDGIERNEVYVTDEQKTVMSISVRVVWDRVWLNNELIEETYDWYAQDSEENVWYMGEDSVEIASGEIVSHAGSFEAGIDGAKPGIIMFGTPVIGQRYYQEFYQGVAEDQGEILAFEKTINVPYKTLTECIKTLDVNPLKGEMEHKYYCPEVGGVALEISLEDGERVELTSYERDAQPTPKNSLIELTMPVRGLTEEEAMNIALQKVQGVVTDVVIEQKLGRKTYVVEVDAYNNAETDVIIDFETGEVLRIET